MIRSFERDVDEALREFPCLVLKKNGDFYQLSGKLISSGDLKSLYLTKEEAKEIKDIFDVVVVVPSNYKQIGCDIYDYYNSIDWSKIPYQHIHKNKKIGNHLYALCTNVPPAVEEMENPILENLRTAYVLVTEYKRYFRNGKYELKEYSHGEEGIKEYEREKKNKS